MPLIDLSELAPYPDDTLIAEHRELIIALNRFHGGLSQAVRDGAELGTARRQLEELQHRCSLHFRREEGYLKGLGYPQLTQHRIAHERFEGLLQEIQRALAGRTDAGEILVLVEETLSALMVRHMNEADHAAALFAAERGARPDS